MPLSNFAICLGTPARLVEGDALPVHARAGEIEGPNYLVDVTATALTHLLDAELDPAWQLDGGLVGLKVTPGR